ncbi:MAG: L-fuculose-phosphate aldolase [Desulfoprunum sp.]|jgi:L-fuculose-phosphate aldolase|uniref:L-fuculose-phosphate aldolase n=1 Tax=Desulfoprunum sp. TaxID=2020866 RepID=UPI00052BE89B|nr:fuculose phosphate aldolase [Desulfobulbus sp. Tol-SR]
MTLLLEQERRLICRFGRKLIEDRLIRGTSGNLSLLDRLTGLVAISPSGLDYLKMTPDDIVVVDLDGRVQDGTRKPSSELPLHRVLYQNRADIAAVVHTHSTFSTVLSCLGWDLPAVHYMLTPAGENVRCSRYATFGSAALAENALEAMTDRHAVLLANHGLVAAGPDLAAAYATAAETEFCAELYWRSRCVGQPNILDHTEMEKMAILFKSYGQK